MIGILSSDQSRDRMPLAEEETRRRAGIGAYNGDLADARRDIIKQALPQGRNEATEEANKAHRRHLSS